jgi:hypothetical protein
MKKLLFIALVALLLLSCTDNQRARNFGGKEVVELPKNRILLNATWKETDLWLLTKDTITNQIYFNESSNWGILEGSIEFRQKQ